METPDVIANITCSACRYSVEEKEERPKVHIKKVIVSGM